MPKRRSPGEGSIFQITSGPRAGKWVATYEVGREGERRKRKHLFGDRREDVRQRLIAAQRKGIARGNGASTAVKTIGQLVNLWIDDRERVGRQPRTIESYRDTADRHVLPHAGTARLDRFDATDVLDLDKRLRRNGVGARSRELAFVVLKASLQMAVRHDWMDRNPAAGVERPGSAEEGETGEMSVWTEIQSQRFLAFAKDDAYEAAFIVALHQGLGPAELFGLQWVDVDLTAGELFIQRNAVERKGGKLVVGPLKRRSRRRRLTLTATTRAALATLKETLFAKGVRSKWVFPDTGYAKRLQRASTGPSRSSNVRYRHFLPIIQRANESLEEELAKLPARERHRKLEELTLPTIRLYDLRHTFATLQLLAGTPLKVVSEILGHASTKITADTYMHVLPNMQRDAALRIEEVLRPIPAPKAVL
jgi:integrase